jgi:S-adenosylmethionine hydrolase
VVLAVVDPGVGSERPALALDLDGCWFVGPDNGLFELVLRRAQRVAPWAIAWRPPEISASFHGRDLFAPVAAALARGQAGGLLSPAEPAVRPPWPDDLPAIVYVDGYGNAMTGLRAALVPAAAQLRVGGASLGRARTFSDVAPGEGFWYANSSGLVEIAVNAGHAARTFALTLGGAVEIVPPQS